jgi:hypothetical protein
MPSSLFLPSLFSFPRVWALICWPWVKWAESAVCAVPN